ncbi:hypothetical protein Poli38472_014184 [Pythium oligandrum]|uniref:ABC transporter domain-containing protein n=1 Tax=Pythium oligandrum TaxID=41045 RepID=A0A8K1FLQ2_PYTOL|nr:hypothetical protein Poli38472_014184 [Pythium oligandrum]|eukprot:TMW64067.1 hypothetical protein Poli38472_014184 [Pythium oligandrum]
MLTRDESIPIMNVNALGREESLPMMTAAPFNRVESTPFMTTPAAPKEEVPNKLSSRRTTWTHVKTLLAKNWLLKRRHGFATFLEVALPCLFILLLGVLKGLTTDVNVPAGWSTDDGTKVDDSIGTSYNFFTPTGSVIPWVPTPLPKFYMHEGSLSGLLLSLGNQSIIDGIRLDELSATDLAKCKQAVAIQGYISTNSSSPYKVPDICGGKVAPYKIGIAPDTAFTRDYFLNVMDQWYPRIKLSNSTKDGVEIPSLRDAVEFFKTAQDLEDYVKGKEYGDGASRPRIYGALVFDKVPSESNIGKFESIEYTIRMNSTTGRNNVEGVTPSTGGDPPELSPFRKALEVDHYSRYAVTGFMALQTLVTRFVTCMPKWDASKKTTNGECQRVQSTAVASDELDDQLLSTLNEDARIRFALSALLSGGNSSSSASNMSSEAHLAPPSVSFTDLLATSSPSVREAFLKPLRQAPQPYLGGAVAPFPIDSYVSSPFYDQVKDVFALIFILSYLYCVSSVLVGFIQEKESRIREYLKILGVKEKAIIISWYITYTAILFVGSILQALAGLAGLFENSSVIVIFLFFFLFGISLLSFGFLVSTLFSKARSGAFVGMIFFFLMYFVSTVFTPQTAENAKTIGCLLSPVALSLGVKVVANLESTGAGITFSNMDVLSENFRFSTSLIFFVIDSILYTALGLYFEKVIPKDYGTTLKWYFPVSPSYWRGRRAGRVPQKDENLHVDTPDNVIVDVNPAFEPVNAELREQERNGDVLSVQRIRKVFSVPGGEKVAVKGLNLVMYKDQITCLLGHNGAGKTTLISMLTGMIAPTSGDATFRGLKLTEDMDEIRESLGICFQHDVLFADLTVEEHLIMFGRIKGYAGDELQQVVTRQITEVGLTEKRGVKSSELSGGMKRKLSVAVSLLGDSSLVFLDEPTSGMDPYSRRSTWEILLNNRNDRVMVLTTHFMDEADILGDRIAIMSEGELRCCGSSLFLKNRYGAGYNLTLVKDDQACNDSEVINFITSYVPNAQVLSNVGSEIAFQLPLDSSSQFAGMFAELDANLSKLALLSYGVSVTTLEEVFIKVAEAGDEDNQHTLTKDARVVDSVPVPSPTNSSTSSSFTTSGLFGAHLHALLLKRFRVAKRDRKMLVFSTILPVLLLLAGLLLLKSSSFTNDDPLLPLTTDAFESKDQSPTPFFCQADDGKWCSTMMSPKVFTGALPEQLSSDVMKKYDSESPTVFGVKYTDPKINTSDATGYGLRLGEVLYKRGYGKDQDFVASQYGAYLVHGEGDRNIIGYNVFTNTTSTHGAPIFKALMDQAIYRFFASNTSSDASANVDLKVNNHPLPLSATTKALITSVLSFTSCLFIVIAFAYFPASIVVFLVKERESSHNAKHQQLVSGVSLPAFWLSNYLWDMAIYMVPFIAAIVLIQAFDISSFTGNDCVACSSATFPAVVLLFLLFGLAICPFTYCMSYLFSNHASAQTYTIMINYVIGLVLMVVSFILDIIESTEDANAVLVFLWRLSPLFSLGNGLLRLSLNEITSILDSDKDKPSPFSGELMGYEMLYLFLSAIGYSALAVGIDYALTFPRVKNLTNNGQSVEEELYEEDEDVIKEAQRVQSGPVDDVVVLKNLRKVYKGGKVAVRNLNFGLKKGECFGFLGINGAGKTTTMKMLTGDVIPSSGTATLSGFDILTQQIEVRRQIGYCPQFDALFELLTVREHLELFARIKGVSRAALDEVVSEKIQQLNLASFENKLAGSLSGGNKRKLSVAIAMIGNPQIIFLDEPSTGMDPVSRRFMWDVIAGISTRGKSSTVVLTTHSMEESEALCSRVSIMVGGRLRCLGSVQHLKSRFGDGLVFDVKMTAPSHEELQEVVDRVMFDANSFVSSDEIADKCRIFGNAELASRVSADHPTGYSLAAALERDGFIRGPAFCSWCVEETRFDALHRFLGESFGDDNILVMERQNDFCRFKLRGSNAQLRLSTVFDRVERVKSKMHIREYSVSQTTLEQIFNQFASQQLEEQGVARGMMTAA